MKKMALLMTILAIALLSTPLQAEYYGNTGIASKSSTTQAQSNTFDWGIGLGGLAVIATVAGVVASSARTSAKSSH